MQKDELILRVFNLITGDLVDDIETFDDLPMNAKIFLNDINECDLRRPLVHNDFVTKSPSINAISIKYSISYGSAQNLYNRFR